MKAALPLLLVLLPIAAAGTNIYRCTDERGNPLFSDLGCNSSEQLALTPLQTRGLAPGCRMRPFAAPADRQRPQAGAQDNAQRRRAALRRKQAAKQQARLTRRHKQACTAATQLIAQIREKRRKGYDLGESARLRAQLNAAKDDRSRFCS